MRRLHVSLAVAVRFRSRRRARRVHARDGGRGQTPPRQWWVNKDKPGQYGKNKAHIKLADLKARHKGQANWSEVVVDDENYHSTYNQGAPGTKITSRMRPDTREFYRRRRGRNAVHARRSARTDSDEARLGREHPEKDDVFRRSDRQRAGAVGRRESGELQNADARQRCSSAADAGPYGR